mgnify:CR=1 FL=1
MKRKEEHRLSVSRRVKRFVRYMDKTFPLEKSNGVPWHHCINLDTMRVEDAATCPMAQVVGVAGGDFYAACERMGIDVKNERELQHAGLLPYNAESDDKPWTVDYRALELKKLNAAIHAEVAERYRQQPRGISLVA